MARDDGCFSGSTAEGHGGFHFRQRGARCAAVRIRPCGRWCATASSEFEWSCYAYGSERDNGEKEKPWEAEESGGRSTSRVYSVVETALRRRML